MLDNVVVDIVFRNFVTNITAELYAKHKADIGRDLEHPVLVIIPRSSFHVHTEGLVAMSVECEGSDDRRRIQTFPASLQDLHTWFTIYTVSNKRFNLISCRLMTHVLKATWQTNKGSEHISEYGTGKASNMHRRTLQKINSNDNL